MAPRGIKAAKLIKRRGSQAKFVDWVTKQYSRGSRDIEVEVSPPTERRHGDTAMVKRTIARR